MNKEYQANNITRSQIGNGINWCLSIIPLTEMKRQLVVLVDQNIDQALKSNISGKFNDLPMSIKTIIKPKKRLDVPMNVLREIVYVSIKHCHKVDRIPLVELERFLSDEANVEWMKWIFTRRLYSLNRTHILEMLNVRK